MVSKKPVVGAAAVASVALVLVVVPVSSAAISVPTVSVGHAGNAADSTGYGAVSYAYRLGATEVTNAQYAAFLNSVAATDTNNLYNTGMAGSFGGIARSGAPGSYTYAAIAGRANNPVNFVSFWDAARFANWLHNAQPVGPQGNATTEDGAYTLTPGGVANNTVTRNAGWQWAVTSSDEWYKGAYHQPVAMGGDGDDYWPYPTSSNAAPTGAQANYLPSAIGNTVPVGSYSANYYGAFDMGGNVYEWSDTLLAPPVRGPLWGGAYDNIAGWLTPANAYTPPHMTEREQLGFRVVTVPAPSSVALLVCMGLASARGRRRRA